MNHLHAPFFEAVLDYGSKKILPYHTPGHKQGRGAPAPWRQALGLTALQMDVSDVLHAPEWDDNWFDVLALAESMAADALGADACRFLVNGTTGGIHALIAAAVQGRDRPVIVARHSHRSVIGGLILADAVPVYVESSYDERRGLWLPPSPDAWGAALEKNPEAAAVLVTYPSYEGVAPDLKAIVERAEPLGVPVLVDEAHGPHFGLHPRLPRRALDLGAEWTAQSPHKLLGSLTQSSWLAGRPRRIGEDAVAVALGILQTTSPSALLLASLDVARRQMALEGEAMMERALAAADEVREAVEGVAGLRNVRFDKPFWDETKLLFDVSPSGLTGFAAARRLREAGLQVEMGTARHVLALATFGDTPETVAALIRGLKRLAAEAELDVRAGDGSGIRPRVDGLESAARSLPDIPPRRLRPRQAALGPSRFVPLAAATGEIAADVVCPYPPGIPVLCPGEEVSLEAVEYLQDILHSGGEVRGISGDVKTPAVRVVAG